MSRGREHEETTLRLVDRRFVRLPSLVLVATAKEGGEIQRPLTMTPLVVAWNPKDKSLTDHAPDFESFLQDWLTSTESVNPNRNAATPNAKSDSKFMSEVLSECNLMRQVPPDSRMLNQIKAEALEEVALSSVFRKPTETPRPSDSIIVKKRKPIALSGIVENGMIRLLDAGVTLPEQMQVIVVVTEPVTA